MRPALRSPYRPQHELILAKMTPLQVIFYLWIRAWLHSLENVAVWSFSKCKVAKITEIFDQKCPNPSFHLLEIWEKSNLNKSGLLKWTHQVKDTRETSNACSGLLKRVAPEKCQIASTRGTSKHIYTCVAPLVSINSWNLLRRTRMVFSSQAVVILQSPTGQDIPGHLPPIRVRPLENVQPLE